MAHPRDIKPDPYRAPTQEEIARGREMYAQGFTVSRCLAATGMSLGTFYYWLDGGPLAEPPPPFASATAGRPEGAAGPDAVDGRPALTAGAAGDDGIVQTRLLPPVPRRRVVAGKRRAPLKTDRVSLTARLWRTAERQVRDIEERLARPARSGPERERDVRMLASLTRTLRDLAAFERTGPGGAAEPEPDVEALRRSLARKLEAIIAERDADEAAFA